MDSLLKEKNERLSELSDLKKQDDELCVTLCTTPYYIPSGSVPSRTQLQELQEHVEKLGKEKVCILFPFKSVLNTHEFLSWMLLLF